MCERLVERRLHADRRVVGEADQVEAIIRRDPADGDQAGLRDRADHLDRAGLQAGKADRLDQEEGLARRGLGPVPILDAASIGNSSSIRSVSSARVIRFLC